MLVRWCIERARAVKPKLKIGICGEHGGDADSVRFFHQVGMDYVSASPVPGTGSAISSGPGRHRRARSEEGWGKRRREEEIEGQEEVT